MVFEMRSATADDQSAVAMLLQEAKLAPLDSSSQFGPQYAVAFDSGSSLAGVAGVEVYGHVGLLRSVAVVNTLRRQGLGKALAANRIAWAASQGLKELYLLTNDAVDYWRSHGFTVIDRSQAPDAVKNTSEWTSSCPASATAMTLRLERRDA